MRAPSAIALKLTHPLNRANSWKQVLNNLRLVIQPSVIFNLLQPWLELFPFRDYQLLECLVALMNRFQATCHATSRRLPLFLCLERHKSDRKKAYHLEK